jgi:hypothetical protein
VTLPLFALLAALALPAAGQAYLVGIADQPPPGSMNTMFSNPLYTKLIAPQPASQRISRYIAPYDVADGNPKNLAFLNTFRLYYQQATAAHVQVMVAFYHSELTRSNGTPPRQPSTALYTRDIQKFFRLFPHIKTYQPWNESNRGTIRGLLYSPSASQAASYYLALKKVCHGCTIAGLDVLDGPSIRPTINYINEFKRDVIRARGKLPTIWGLHNYSDTNRNRTLGTRAVLADTSGQLWLTETGGVVQLGHDFTNVNGAGLKRAAGALSFMFRLATLSSRIKRLYIFQWSGGTPNVRFDAGLLDANGKPRPGYYVVCKKFLRSSSACTGPVSDL